MNRATSFYLDASRFLAAMTVFLGHLAGKRFTDGFLWPLSGFMGMAVTVFFVLSGYVIAYVAETTEKSLSHYTVNRLARIYSVAAPALVITFCLDALGIHAKPALYNASWGFSHHAVWWQYLSALTFTNQLWWENVSPGSMLPYWSLGYEVWYYIIFAAVWYLRGARRLGLAALFALIAGPRILLLFPIWLTGFGAYELSRHNRLPSWVAATGIAGALVAILILLALVVKGHFFPEPLYIKYFEGLVFAFTIICVSRLGPILNERLVLVERPVKWLAGMTFSLYLYHLPVAQFLITQQPEQLTAWLSRLTILVGTFVIVVLLAQITERRKKTWRGMFMRLGFGESLREPSSPRSSKAMV